MKLNELTRLMVRKIDFGPPAPEELPAPYIVARRHGDRQGSFTIFSTRPEDVARCDVANRHTVKYGPIGRQRCEVWAIMAYATSYRALMGAIDLLNVGLDLTRLSEHQPDDHGCSS